MKRFMTVLLSCLLISGGVILCAQSKSGKVKQKMLRDAEKRSTTLKIPSQYVKVNVSLERAPIYSTDNLKAKIGSSSTSSGIRYWLKNDIHFSFIVPDRVFREAGSRFVTIERLRIEMYLRVPAPKTKRENAVWFYGSQLLHGVLLDEKYRKQSFYASLFMPPMYVEQYLPREERSGGDSQKGKFSVKEAEGVILFYNKENVRVGYTVFSQSRRLTPEEERNILQRALKFREHPSSNTIMLWPREVTPWQWLEADRYELPLTEFPEDAIPLRNDKKNDKAASGKEKNSGSEEDSADTEE